MKDIDEFENTIIIFLSDNGSNPFYSADYPGADQPEFIAQFDASLENLGHPGSNFAYGPGYSAASSGPLDRFKQTVGEGGIRVPLIVAGPGINAGAKTDAFAYVWDILPTILDAVGTEYPSTFDEKAIERPRGRSILPILKGEAERIYGDNETVSGEMAGGKWVRKGNYKAVSVPPPYGDGKWRLYDMAVDPGESIDLGEKAPQLLSDLISVWETYAEEVGVVPAEL